MTAPRVPQFEAAIGLAILVVVLTGFAAGLSTPRVARRVGDLAARAVSWGKRLFRKKPVTWDGEAFVRFRARTNSLLRRRWHVLTLATLAGHLTVYLVLLVSLRVLGVSADEVTVVEAFAAWSLVRLLGSIGVGASGFAFFAVSLAVGSGASESSVVLAWEAAGGAACARSNSDLIRPDRLGRS